MDKPLIKKTITTILSTICMLTVWYCPSTTGAHEVSSDEIYEMDLSELMELEVVTATGTKMKLRETPSAVYIISERDIRARGYRTLIDALQDIPGFDIQHTYGLFPDLVHQRGLIGNNQRSLVYIDGILDNNISENAILGGTIRYPLHNVEQIEIVAGPVSALYGANAFNGVINIITKDGKKTSDKNVQAFIGTWMDQDYLGKGSAFALNDSTHTEKGRFACSIGGYYYNSDGPDFRGVQKLDENGLGYWWSDTYNNSNEETYNITAKFSFDNLRFEVINWQYLQGDGTFANGTYQIDTNGSGFSGSAWDFQSTSLDLGYLWEISPQLSLDSEALIQNSRLLSSSHESYPNTPGPDAYNFPEDVTTVSGYARPDDLFKIEERLQWQPSDQFDNTVGLELIFYDVPKGYGSYERYKYENYAGYLQSIYRMNEIFSFVGGYRFDHSTAYGDSNTFRVSAIANPGDCTIKAMFSTGFRGPTAWELVNETRQRMANLHLDPEHMRSFELGLGYALPFKGHLSLQGYYNVINDLILEVETNVPNPNPESEFWNQNQNIGKANIYGIEFDSDFTLTDKLSLYMNYTFSRGEYKNLPEMITTFSTAHDGESIPNIPKHKANIGFTYGILYNLSFHLRANYLYKIQTIQSNPVKEIDDKVIFHSNIRWENAVVDGLFLTLLIRNIFDTDDAFDAGIRTATGGYYPTQQPIEGRNIWLTVGYEF
ncbi:MAG: TonB-dependent receptor [Desulfobacteraceae bacterium]|nr:TonB-dependent receptor [Desulfobacteraceae bacterium]MBC2757491.1 TonB-dependent receptor [Desulfobacteraceae bacterium]